VTRLALGLLAGIVVLALAPAAGAKSLAGFARDVVAPVPVSGPIAHTTRSSSQMLPYGGGPVLHSNRTHVIFWQPAGSGLTFEAGYVSLVERFLIDVAADSHATSNPYGLTGQYTDAKGRAVYASTYGGAITDTDSLPANGCVEPPVTGPGWTTCLTDGQLAAEIEHVVSSEHLPTTDHDVYFLVTPKGLGDCTDGSSSSCALGGHVTGYCGYHSQTSDGRVLYAVIPYNAVSGHCQSGKPRPNRNPADPALSTMSHEHNEMITDPEDDAWINSSGEEDGDLCITTFGPAIGGSGATAYNESIHGGHYFLQEEWSNADGGCAPRARADSLSFAVSPPPSTSRWLTLSGQASAPERSVVGYDWSFGDGRTGRGRRVRHLFTRSGRYTVSLRSTDSWGDWAYYTRTIRVSGTA
jgi:PKD domain